MGETEAVRLVNKGEGGGGGGILWVKGEIGYGDGKGRSRVWEEGIQRAV